MKHCRQTERKVIIIKIFFINILFYLEILGVLDAMDEMRLKWKQAQEYFLAAEEQSERLERAKKLVT